MDVRDHILLLYWIYICFNLPLLYMVIKAPAIDLGDMLIQLFLQQLLKTHTQQTSVDIDLTSYYRTRAYNYCLLSPTEIRERTLTELTLTAV